MIAPDFRLTDNLQLVTPFKNFICGNYSKFSPTNYWHRQRHVGTDRALNRKRREGSQPDVDCGILQNEFPAATTV